MPVRTIALTFCCGKNRDKPFAPPTIPIFISGSEKNASSEANTISPQAANIAPAPTAPPLTAQINGTGHSYKHLIAFLKKSLRIVASISVSFFKLFTSAPAEDRRFHDYKTTEHIHSSF